MDFRETNFQSLPHLVLFQKTSLRRNSIIQKKMNQKNHKNDSRDLNEPYTNINNGLGIFSGFASQEVYFEVIKQ